MQKISLKISHDTKISCRLCLLCVHLLVFSYNCSYDSHQSTVEILVLSRAEKNV